MQRARKIREALGLNLLPKFLRRIVVGIIGGTIVLFGIALIFLPGPGSLVIPIGLVVLASEFTWARWILRRGKKVVKETKDKLREGIEAVRPS
ncbi:MAG TPA: PGPGW domain-containing protein [Chthoniobacterales bacterium]|nr:PGPGW domain-containing protein [Chthoniobacterales bacterium]